MFFKTHQECKIGYKTLTAADLGFSLKSNQTHIGLYQKVLGFLNDEDSTLGMLIYENYCDILECDFDRIMNPDGSFRSPKIRKGSLRANTVVKKIREFASQHPQREYYLVWFGIEGNGIVFWLIDNTSNDYNIINSFLPHKNKVYDTTSFDSEILLQQIEHKIDNVSTELQKDLEIASQIGTVTRKFTRYDIKKAEERFAQIGKQGEELVADYLDRRKHLHLIDSYIWCNKNRESGLPYDFIINQNHFIDVKSTLYRFNQQIVFSNREFEFISTKRDSSYSVYRVFDMSEAQKKLIVCQQCKSFVQSINVVVKRFEGEMDNLNAKIQPVKIAVNPERMFKTIGPEILLQD